MIYEIYYLILGSPSKRFSKSILVNPIIELIASPLLITLTVKHQS